MMKTSPNGRCHSDKECTGTAMLRTANDEIGDAIHLRRTNRIHVTSFELRSVLFLLFMLSLNLMITDNYQRIHREMDAKAAGAEWKSKFVVRTTAPGTSTRQAISGEGQKSIRDTKFNDEIRLISIRQKLKHNGKSQDQQPNPDANAWIQYSQQDKYHGPNQHTKRKLTANIISGNENFLQAEKTLIFPNDKLYCSPWELNIDDWWQDHPDWEESRKHTNATHTCFQPIANTERATLLKEVHAIQFPDNIKEGCKNLATRQIYNVGFGFNMYQAFGKLFYTAFREGRPFRASIQGNSTFRWLYVPPDGPNEKAGNDSWATCATQDHECYFLPVSSCPRPIARKDEKFKRKMDWELFGNGPKKPGNKTLLQQKIWMDNFLMRPRQALRQKLYQFMQDPNNGVPSFEEVTAKCSWIHVRRADAMSEKGYARNFYPIKKYLERGQIGLNETVLLFTDDDSAIEEAILLHPEYNWVYMNRTRHRGPVDIHSHIPSQEPSLELLIMLAEKDLAAMCDKGVHGTSSYFKHLQAGMIARKDIAGLTFIAMDMGLKKTRIEAEEFMKALNERIEKARK